MKVSEYFEQGRDFPQISIGDKLRRVRGYGGEYQIIKTSRNELELLHEDGTCWGRHTKSEDWRLTKEELAIICAGGSSEGHWEFKGERLNFDDNQQLPLGTRLRSPCGGEDYLSTEAGLVNLRTGKIRTYQPKGPITRDNFHHDGEPTGYTCGHWKIISLGQGA